MLFRSSPIFLVIFRVWDPFETTPLHLIEYSEFKSLTHLKKIQSYIKFYFCEDILITFINYNYSVKILTFCSSTWTILGVLGEDFDGRGGG